MQVFPQTLGFWLSGVPLHILVDDRQKCEIFAEYFRSVDGPALTHLLYSASLF